MVSINNNYLLQLQLLFNKPLYVISIFINTFKTCTIFYIRGLVGYFGWFAYHINDVYIAVYFLLFWYICNGEASTLSNKNKLILFISVFISVFGCFLAMYLFSTNYKASYIEGVQGRYFIPLIIPFVISFMGKKEKKNVENKNIYYVINILLFQFIMSLAIWYY